MYHDLWLKFGSKSRYLSSQPMLKVFTAQSDNFITIKAYHTYIFKADSEIDKTPALFGKYKYRKR